MKSKDETSQSWEARVFSEAVERMLPGSAYIEQSTAIAGCLTLQDVQCSTGERPRQFQSLPLREAAAAAVGIRVTDWREPARFDVPSWARKYADDIKDPAAKKLIHQFIDLVGACEFRWNVKAEDRVTFKAVLDVAAEFWGVEQKEIPITKQELIDRHSRYWPKVENHIGNASRNGLKEAAGVPDGKGWFEGPAVDFAKAKGWYRVSGVAASSWHPHGSS